jgi:hypothetical protein
MTGKRRAHLLGTMADVLTLTAEELGEPLNPGLRAWQAERRRLSAEGERLHAEAAAAWKASAPERRRAASAARGAARRAAERSQCPPWADRDAIRAVYAEARRLTIETGRLHHVDHDIPLRGRLVSGLHVEGNLVVMEAGPNMRKHNHFEP